MAAIIGGVNYSWGNLNVVLFGNIVIGITKISYKRKQEKTNNYGWGTKPVYRGYGREEYEGSMELYTDEWKKLIASSPSNNPLLLLPSDIQIVFAGSRVLPNKDVLQAIEFTEDGLEAAEGDTKLLITIPIIIGDISRQGAV